MSRHFSLLVVDDAVHDRFFIQEVIRKNGLRLDVRAVTDGVEAQTALQGGYRPDLILLDLNMPQMHGLEFLAWMKADLIYRAIPVVMLTTSAADPDVTSAYDLGAAVYVAKPLGLPQFVEILLKVHDLFFATALLPMERP